MIKLNLLHLLLQGIPESVASAALVYALNNYRFDWKKMIIIGVLQGFTIYLVRLLPITWGLHSFLAIISLSIYVQVFTKGIFTRIIITSILAVLFIAFLEFIIFFPVLKFLNISLVEASKRDLLWLIMSWPQVAALFITAVLIKRYHERKAGQSIEKS